MNSPFEILLIDSDADEEEIEQAFRRRVKETHPDQGGSSREFRRVKAAYEAIKAGNTGGVSRAQREDIGEKGSQRENISEQDSQREPRVEYLNYEVLDDHGWALDDDDLFEKAAAEGLDTADYGQIRVEPDEHLLAAVEDHGFTWPYSCRGGACANCAVAVTEGELSMPASHVLPDEMLDRGIQLSCVGVPTTDEIKIVYNVKHLPDLDELRLPPGPFKRANASD